MLTAGMRFHRVVPDLLRQLDQIAKFWTARWKGEVTRRRVVTAPLASTFDRLLWYCCCGGRSEYARRIREGTSLS